MWKKRTLAGADALRLRRDHLFDARVAVLERLQDRSQIVAQRRHRVQQPDQRLNAPVCLRDCAEVPSANRPDHCGQQHWLDQLAELEQNRKVRLLSHAPAKVQLLEILHRQQLAIGELPASKQPSHPGQTA